MGDALDETFTMYEGDISGTITTVASNLPAPSGITLLQNACFHVYDDGSVVYTYAFENSGNSGVIEGHATSLISAPVWSGLYSVTAIHPFQITRDVDPFTGQYGVLVSNTNAPLESLQYAVAAPRLQASFTATEIV